MESESGWLRPTIIAAAAGDRAAVDLLVRRYRPYLHVQCGLQFPRFCRRRADASDIVQETLLDVARDIRGFRGATEGEFEAWLQRLLDRNLLQSIRQNTAARRDVRRELEGHNEHASTELTWTHFAEGDAHPSQSVLRGEAALLVADALMSLPDPQRLAVELRFLGHHKLDEIARLMETTKGAVAGLIRRGIEALRDRLPAELAESSDR